MAEERRGTCRIEDCISVQGYAHILHQKPCQDRAVSWQGEGYSAIIVCDGHGGEKYIYSKIGARYACEAGKECIGRFMENVTASAGFLHEKNAEDLFFQLERAIICTWQEKISSKPFSVKSGTLFCKLSEEDKKELRKNPVKAYGTTFLAAVMADDFCFVLKLGDGNALIYFKNGEVLIPAELEDETLQFNRTTSMCNSDAAQCFRHWFCAFGRRKPCGMTLTSDGVINCFAAQEPYISFMKNVFAAYGEKNLSPVKKELQDTLNTLSEKGSGDDLSLAVIRCKD